MPDFKVEIIIDPCKIRYNGCRIDPCNSVYLSFEVFNKIQSTKECLARFPINFLNTFKFTQCFFGCSSYFSVLEKLYDFPVTIELVEVVNSCSEFNRSYFDSNIRDLTGLCDSGPKICEARCVTLCNKPSYQDIDEPVVIMNIQSQICRLPLFDDGDCEDINLSMPSRCYPKSCSPRRSVSPRQSFSTRIRCPSPRSSYCSPRRNRSLSPLRSPTIISSPYERSSPALCRPYTRRRSCNNTTNTKYWDIEIERLTKNLREVSEQIRCLLSMQRTSNRISSPRTSQRRLSCSPRDRFMRSLENRPIPGQRWTI